MVKKIHDIVYVNPVFFSCIAKTPLQGGVRIGSALSIIYLPIDSTMGATKTSDINLNFRFMAARHEG